jgi:hypothetical protein
MAVDVNDGLILNILLSTTDGPNSFPNINFVKTTDWDQVQGLADGEPLGRGLFKRVGEESYKTARANLQKASPAGVKNDAFALTRSVERLTTADDGTGPWDGGFPHPSNAQLAAWVSKLKA